jgi:hypothetical protein
MSRARLKGEWLRLFGSFEEQLGAWLGHDALRMRGERDRWIGHMEVSCAIIRQSSLFERLGDGGAAQRLQPRSVAGRVALRLAV